LTNLALLMILTRMKNEAAAWHIPPWTVGDRLRKAREEAGWNSQEAFGKKIGVSRGTVQNYESGRISPERMKEIYLREWSRVTGVPVEWFKTGIEPYPSEPTRGGVRLAVAPAARAKTANRAASKGAAQPGSLLKYRFTPASLKVAA